MLIRHLPSVETLGSVTVICTDKTGTLTENRMCAQRVLLDLQPFDVETLAGDPELINRNDFFFKAARYCQDLTETIRDGQRGLDGDPLEIALVEMSERFGALPAPPTRCDEWPFDSDRMRQSVAYPDGTGHMLYCKGALESVLPLCVSFNLCGETRLMDDSTRAKILCAQDEMAVQGLRVIALAARHLSFGCPREAQEQDLIFCGLVGVNDPPRSGVDTAIAACHGAGIKVIMVTGDLPSTALAIARQIGLTRSKNVKVIVGSQLRNLSAELMPSLAFALFAVPLPLTPVQVLAVDMGTDSLTALALGAERGHSQTMRRPPRSRKEHLMNAVLGLRAYLFLGLIEAAAALAAFFHVLHGGGWQYGTDLPGSDLLYRQATTACLAAIVLLQIVNVFLCRSAIRSIFTTGLGGNPLMLWGVLLQVVLILFIVYTSWGHALFATAALPMEVWLFLLPWAIGMIAAEELRKWLARRQLAHSQVKTCSS